MYCRSRMVIDMTALAQSTMFSLKNRDITLVKAGLTAISHFRKQNLRIKPASLLA